MNRTAKHIDGCPACGYPDYVELAIVVAGKPNMVACENCLNWYERIEEPSPQQLGFFHE